MVKRRIHQGHLFMLEDAEPKTAGPRKEVSAKDVLGRLSKKKPVRAPRGVKKLVLESE